MQIIDPGHVYRLYNADGEGTQTIRFVRRRGDDGERIETKSEGILSQELLRVLINRTLYLNDEDPCIEDVEIVHKLRDCLKLYESRAARRTIEKLSMPEKTDACPICHHLLCNHRTNSRLDHDLSR